MSVADVTLFTRCIYLPKQADDGVRISVMSRHTLADGTTLDLRISEKSFDEWRRDLAPPTSLVGSYYKRGLSWNSFEERYLAYLRNQDLQSKLIELAEDAFHQDITLLCAEEYVPGEVLKCHRRVLADECARLVQQLLVVHR